MTQTKHLEDLMQQIGPLADLIAVDQFRTENTWRLLVEDDFAIIVEFDAEANVLVLTADVGEPSEMDRLRLYELLLQYNRHCQETGAVMAIEAEGGPIVQVCRHPAEGLDGSALASIITALAERSREWRRVVRETSPPSLVPGFSQELFHLIRV